jgi:hypothetical protein
MIGLGIPGSPLAHEYRMSEQVHEHSNAELQADRASRDLIAWSILAGLMLLGALAGPFFAGRVYTADDLGAFHLPLRAFYAEQIASGQSYDWMPQLFSGFYLTGEGQTGAYHPLHQLLYRFLPLRAALGWEYLLPYPLIMLGTFLWLWRRLDRCDAAVLGGLLFTFSSFNLLHFVHPNAIAIVAHIPWLLWAIDIVLTDSRRRRVALATALIALLTGSQLLLGYPQFVWFSLVAELSYAIFLQTAHRYTPRTGCNLCSTCYDCVGCCAQTWPRIVIAKGIGLLVGGVQLLPSLDAWMNSARLSADADFAFWGSLHPLNLLQLVAPYLFTGRVMGDNTHEFGLYAGAVPLMLIVWLLARRRELGPLRPLVWATLGFAVLMLLLSFGQFGFLYRLTACLPGMRTFRFPCRYIVLFQLAVAMLAAIGFLLLSRENPQERQSATGEQYAAHRAWLAFWHDFEPLWCVVGFAVAVAVAGLKLRNEPYIASIPAVLAGPVLLGAAAALVALAARGRSAALVGLILLAALDLGSYGLSYSAYPRSAKLETYVAAAKTPPGKPDGRVVGSLYRFDEPGMRTGDLMTLAGWRRADGYAGLEPQRQLDYRLLPALRVAGVRWVKRGPSTNEVAGLKPCDNDWLEVPDPLPRVRMVARVQTSNNPGCDMAVICPDTTALCEVPLVLPASKPGKAVLTAQRPGWFEIAVDCPAPQLLVVAESYHSGWHAAVDAGPQKVYRVNGDFMGCVVGPGKHRVVLDFQPDSLQRGRLASCLGLGFVCICIFGSLACRKPKRPEDDLP